MVHITGIGWITSHEYGCMLKKESLQYRGVKSLYFNLIRDGVIIRRIKNFDRFDTASQITCCSVALALKDAGVLYGEGKKQDIGILGTSNDGSLEANVRYFTDYINAGRKLARGNLFIYTLPTSSLSEAAIYFGFRGPTLFMLNTSNTMRQIVSSAEEIIVSGESETILGIYRSEVEALCFVFKIPGLHENKGIRFKNIMDAISDDAPVGEITYAIKRMLCA